MSAAGVPPKRHLQVVTQVAGASRSVTSPLTNELLQPVLGVALGEELLGRVQQSITDGLFRQSRNSELKTLEALLRAGAPNVVASADWEPLAESTVATLCRAPMYVVGGAAKRTRTEQR